MATTRTYNQNWSSESGYCQWWFNDVTGDNIQEGGRSMRSFQTMQTVKGLFVSSLLKSENLRFFCSSQKNQRRLQIFQRDPKTQEEIKNNFSVPLSKSRSAGGSLPTLVQKGAEPGQSRWKARNFSFRCSWMIWRINNKRKKEKGGATRQIMHSFIRN